MIHRFVRKIKKNRYVRPRKLKKSALKYTVVPKVAEETKETEIVETANTEVVELTQPTETVEATENNTENITEDMVTTDTLKEIENALENETKPKKRVRVEKKEKGLVERTDTVLLTEDNKMLLND